MVNYFTILHVRIVAVSTYVSILHIYQVWCCKSTVEAKPGIVQGHMKFALAWRPWMLSMGMYTVFFVILIKKLRPLPVGCPKVFVTVGGPTTAANNNNNNR